MFKKHFIYKMLLFKFIKFLKTFYFLKSIAMI